MPFIEVSQEVKGQVALAAKIAGISENAVIQALIADLSPSGPVNQVSAKDGVAIHANYEGQRTRARFLEPARVEILDGPLRGQSFKSPTGAARAVIRLYNPKVNDNRNGWTFWVIDEGDEKGNFLQSIRP